MIEITALGSQVRTYMDEGRMPIDQDHGFLVTFEDGREVHCATAQEADRIMMQARSYKKKLEAPPREKTPLERITAEVGNNACARDVYLAAHALYVESEGLAEEIAPLEPGRRKIRV